MYLSCIIIGKNEAEHIIDCVNSLYTLLDRQDVKSYEILYIDSCSQDDSISVVKREFPEIKIYRITGDVSAAIGRNIGVLESSGEYLFFIDADTKLDIGFLNSIINKDGKIDYDFVSGQVVDKYSDGKSEVRYKSAINEDQYSYISGGIFIVKKTIWDAVKGFNTKYKYAEEPDFSLRIAKVLNIKFLRKSQIICEHYTERLNDCSKILHKLSFPALFDKKVVLFRDHLLNKYAYPTILKDKISAFYLLFSLLILIITGNTWLLCSYLLVVFISSSVHYKKCFFKRFLYKIITDIGVPIAMLFYFPKRRELRYERVY